MQNKALSTGMGLLESPYYELTNKPISGYSCNLNFKNYFVLKILQPFYYKLMN